MSWGIIAMATILVVYVANILGCLVLCETIPEVEQSRRYVWLIPIMIFLTPFCCIFDTSVKKKIRFILVYIIEPHKSITMIYAMMYALEKRKIKEQQPDSVYNKSSRRRQRAYVFADIVENYGVSFSAKWAG